jgi:hypothetical protein
MALIVGVVAVLVIRQPTERFDLTREDATVARSAHEWLEEAPLVEAANRDGIIAALDRAEEIPGQLDPFEPSEEMRRDLFELVANFLDYRARGDVDGYIAWMNSLGYQLSLRDPDASRHYSLQEWDVRNAWQVYTGQEAPEKLAEIDPEQFFRIAFIESLRLKGGFLQGEAASERMQVVFRTIPASRATRPAVMEPWSNIDIWAGRSVSGDRPHWTPEMTYPEVLKRDGVAIVANVFIGLQSASGMWVPMHMAAYYDLAESQWHIESVGYTNSLFHGLAVER